jgi:hypothetical protein
MINLREIMMLLERPNALMRMRSTGLIMPIASVSPG